MNVHNAEIKIRLMFYANIKPCEFNHKFNGNHKTDNFCVEFQSASWPIFRSVAISFTNTKIIIQNNNKKLDFC